MGLKNKRRNVIPSRKEKYYFALLDSENLDIVESFKVTESELREYYEKIGEDVKYWALVESRGIYDVLDTVGCLVDEKYFDGYLTCRLLEDVMALTSIRIKPEDVPKKTLKECLKRYKATIDKLEIPAQTYRRRDIKGNPIRIYLLWDRKGFYVEPF